MAILWTRWLCEFILFRGRVKCDTGSIFGMKKPEKKALEKMKPQGQFIEFAMIMAMSFLGSLGRNERFHLYEYLGQSPPCLGMINFT